MTSAGRASATTAKTTTEPICVSTTAHFTGNQPERIRRSNPPRATSCFVGVPSSPFLDCSPHGVNPAGKGSRSHDGYSPPGRHALETGVVAHDKQRANNLCNLQNPVVLPVLRISHRHGRILDSTTRLLSNLPQLSEVGANPGSLPLILLIEHMGHTRQNMSAHTERKLLRIIHHSQGVGRRIWAYGRRARPALESRGAVTPRHRLDQHVDVEDDGNWGRATQPLTACSASGSQEPEPSCSGPSSPGWG